jgi:kinesin family protein 11
MVGEEQSLLSSSYDDASTVGMIPRALSHLFDKLRTQQTEFVMRVSYLELYNEELCDLLSTDDSAKIRIYDDVNKKGSVIIQGLEEIPVRCKDDVYKLLAKGTERRKTAATLMNAQSSRSHTVFSILVHIKENGPDGDEMLKIGKLNLVDLAGSENASKAGNEKGIRTRESVNINQSLLTLGRVITALVERTPHVPYRESKLTRLLQESLGGRTKTSIIATISCGHKDLEETLSTLDYAHRAKNIQNKPEINQKLTKKVILKEYSEEIDRLKRDLEAAREKNGIYLAVESYNELVYEKDAQEKELVAHIERLRETKTALENTKELFQLSEYNLQIVSEKLHVSEGKVKITEAELTKTKRNLRKTEQNVTEAKHLITCHQETEQKLTEHAKEIITVADEAANDTKSLQENIRRRKEKDEYATRVTNNIMNSLSSRVDEMKDDVEQMEKQHKETSDILISDLDASVKANKSHTNVIVTLLKELKNLRKESNNSLCAKIDVWMSQHNAMSKSELESLTCLIKESQEQEESFFGSISNRIETFAQLLNDRKAEESKLKEYFTEKIDAQQKTIEEFSDFMQLKFNEYRTQLDSVSSSLRAKSEAQNLKMQQMKKLMAELEELSEKDEPIQQQLSSVDKDIEESCIATSKSFIEKTSTAAHANQMFLNEREQAWNKNHELLSKNSQEMSDEVKSFNEKAKGTSKRQHNSVKQFEAKSVEQVNQVKNTIDSLTKSSEEKENVLDAKLVESISKESSETANRLQEIKSVVEHDLHLFVKKAESSMSKNCSSITRDIGDYQQQDVFMYCPTGATPARKDYKFNRQLNATSPHERIIKRLRLDQGLSDSIMHDTSLIEVR